MLTVWRIEGDSSAPIQLGRGLSMYSSSHDFSAIGPRLTSRRSVINLEESEGIFPWLTRLLGENRQALMFFVSQQHVHVKDRLSLAFAYASTERRKNEQGASYLPAILIGNCVCLSLSLFGRFF